MTKAKKIVLAATACVCVVFCGIAEASCIVSGDTSRDSALSLPSTLEWFDSSSFMEYVTPVLPDFNSYPFGFLLIFR